MPYAVSFQQVSRHFGTVRAVDAVDLEIVDGLAKLEPAGTTTFVINAMGRKARPPFSPPRDDVACMC